MQCYRTESKKHLPDLFEPDQHARLNRLQSLRVPGNFFVVSETVQSGMIESVARQESELIVDV